MASKKIILTGGGTAGHCLPNMALVPTLRELGFDVCYIGSYDGIEKKIVEEAGIPYYGISSGKLRRYFDVKNFSDPFRVAKGYREARKLMSDIKPDIVFSKGGYVSVPVVKAAASRHIPVIIHESDMTPGLANKLSYSSASKICCSFRETLQYIPEQKAVFTGSPIRTSLLCGDRERAVSFTSMRKGGYPYILVVGGSLGAQHVNEAVRHVLPELLLKYNVIHLCGRGKTDPTLNNTDGYMQYDYIDQEMADLYALADVVVSRAGSNAIFEILALNKPNILVPLPSGSSRGDQILNAASFEKAGYSYVLKDEDLSDSSLLSAIDHVYGERQSYADAMSRASETMAVSRICELINETVTKEKK